MMKRRFNDKVKVHTAPSGTQWVELIDVFFSDEETKRYVDETRKQVEENSKRAAKLPQLDPSLPRISSYAADNSEVHND